MPLRKIPLARDDPVEAGKYYLFRYTFPGWVWLREELSTVARGIESELPVRVIAMDTSSLLTDLNWLNLTLFVEDVFDSPLLPNTVETWAGLIGDLIVDYGRPGGIGAMRFQSAYVLRSPKEAEEIIYGEKPSWLRVLENTAKALAIVAVVWLGVKMVEVARR